MVRQKISLTIGTLSSSQTTNPADLRRPCGSVSVQQATRTTLQILQGLVKSLGALPAVPHPVPIASQTLSVPQWLFSSARTDCTRTPGCLHQPSASIASTAAAPP